jgi:hypothetical protein
VHAARAVDHHCVGSRGRIGHSGQVRTASRKFRPSRNREGRRSTTYMLLPAVLRWSGRTVPWVPLKPDKLTTWPYQETERISSPLPAARGSRYPSVMALPPCSWCERPATLRGSHSSSGPWVLGRLVCPETTQMTSSRTAVRAWTSAFRKWGRTSSVDLSAPTERTL